MATINVSIYKVILGAYKDKYVAIANALNEAISSPIELVDTDTYQLNLPDFNNFNTNGVVESTLLLVETGTVEQEFAFTKKLGIANEGNLFLAQNTQMIMISNDLETSLVDVVFYGLLAQNYLNGSKYCIYTGGAAESVYTLN